MYLGTVWIQYLKLLVVREERKKVRRMLGVINATDDRVWRFAEDMWVWMHMCLLSFALNSSYVWTVIFHILYENGTFTTDGGL